MEQYPETTADRIIPDDQDPGVFCPFLVLSHEIVCDRSGVRHSPTRAHLWQFCMTADYRRCPVEHAPALR